MKLKKRQSKIIDIIRQQGRVTVDDLVAIFDTSAETIRRDLKALSKKGKVRKVHGGATLPGSSEEGPFQQRLGENVEAKRRIAQKAAEIITSGSTLFIATGSSTLILAEELLNIADLTIITNSLDVAEVMGSSKKDARVFLLGGEYSKHFRATYGALVTAQLSLFHVDHVVISAGAIDATAGVMGFDFDEANIENAMLDHAENTILLLDSSKFARIAPYKIGRLNQFDQIICETQPGVLLKEALIKNNVSIVCTDTDPPPKNQN